MCGRYVLSMRYGQVRRELEESGLPTGDFSAEEQNEQEGQEELEGHEEWEEREDLEERDDLDDVGDGGVGEGGEGGVVAGDATVKDTTDKNSLFWPSYNFAPGYRGIVVRPRRKTQKQDNSDGHDVRHAALQMQVMRWGLIPSWTRRRPDYAATRKTINCRADSLASGRGMWTALRGRKRCVVVAEGFYEWLRKGPKERVPHYIRRRDGRPLLMAGLWDRVVWDEKKKEDEYTYTIITTDSNTTLRFLHDRMPVVFDYGSPELDQWLDMARGTWSDELQALLKPWPHVRDDDGAALIVDVVSKEVNKVGHSSASFIVPVASVHNRSNIANAFRVVPDEVKKRPAPTESLQEVARERKEERSAKKSRTAPMQRKPTKPAESGDNGNSRKITSFFGPKNG